MQTINWDLLRRSEQGLNIPFFVDSDSASESSNASSTIEKKTKAVAKPKIKVKIIQKFLW